MADRIKIPEFLRYKYRQAGEPWADKKLELPVDKTFLEVVAVMRANPPHRNHTLMLRELCSKAVKVKINIGSSNKFDRKNPFKINEREDMMRLALKGCKNYELLRLPDVGDDEQWFESLCKINGFFSEILSNNQYDLQIYQRHQKDRKFDILSPVHIIDSGKIVYARGVLQDGAIYTPFKKPIYASGTFVRAGMVNNWNWEDYVDEEVVSYIKRNRLIDRIRQYCPELEGITFDKIDDGR